MEQNRVVHSGQRRPSVTRAGTYSIHGTLLVGALLVVVVIGAYLAGSAKPLWYDELFSVIVAKQTSWHAMRGAMPGDGNPPVYALLTKVCLGFFGSSDFSVRLPSLAGFLGALVGVYIFVRRECGFAYGLLAMALVIAQPGWEYSYEARPYALMLGWIMLGLVSWQAAIRPACEGGRRLALFGIAVALAGGILSHNLGVVMVGFPLLVGEVARTVIRRRPDWPVLATSLVAVPALALTVPLARRTDALLLQYQRNYLHPLTWAKFKQYGISFPSQSLAAILSGSIMLLLVALVVLSWWQTGLRNWSKNPNSGPRDVSSPVLAAAVGCACLMPMTWLVMMLTSGYYLCRYGIGTVLGLALVTCILTRRLRGPDWVVPLVITGMVIAYFGYMARAMHRYHPELPVDRLVYNYRSDLPVVVNDPYRFLPMWWYATNAVRGRLVYLKDEQAAIRDGHVIVEAAMVSEAPYLPLHFETFDHFLATHDYFLLNFTGTANMDMQDRMLARGFKLRPTAIDRVGSMLEVTRADEAWRPLTYER